MKVPDAEARKGALFSRLLGRVHFDLSEGRFRAAFFLAERLLDMHPSAEQTESLLCLHRAISLHAAYKSLRDLQHAADADSPWGRQLRATLLLKVGREPEAFAETEEFKDFPKRYAWMRFHHAEILLRFRSDYRASAAEFRTVVQATPSFWKAQALTAECLLCSGDRRRAFSIMDRVVERLDGFDEASACAWRGEMKLWCGRDREALEDLDAAVVGKVPLAWCWRGAARLRLGDASGAVRELGEALKRSPDDVEALVWRGEALRRLGAFEKSRADLDRVVFRESRNPFARANRALLSLTRGDLASAVSDARAIPDDVLRYFEWKAGTPVEDVISVRKLKELLEDILATGGGVRRGERYLAPLWLSDRP